MLYKEAIYKFPLKRNKGLFLLYDLKKGYSFKAKIACLFNVFVSICAGKCTCFKKRIVDRWSFFPSLHCNFYSNESWH